MTKSFESFRVSVRVEYLDGDCVFSVPVRGELAPWKIELASRTALGLVVARLAAEGRITPEIGPYSLRLALADFLDAKLAQAEARRERPDWQDDWPEVVAVERAKHAVEERLREIHPFLPGPGGLLEWEDFCGDHILPLLNGLALERDLEHHDVFGWFRDELSLGDPLSEVMYSVFEEDDEGDSEDSEGSAE